jgi:hypothetical protein
VPDIPETVPFSQARECPECGHTGKIKHSNPIAGGTVHMMICDNQVCPWYNTGWVIETDANGEVRVNKEAMKRARGERLIAPTDPSFNATFESVHNMLNRQLEQEVRRSE